MDASNVSLQKDGTLELRPPDAHMKQQHSLVQETLLKQRGTKQLKHTSYQLKH